MMRNPYGDYPGIEYDDVREEFQRQEDQILEYEDEKWLDWIDRNHNALVSSIDPRDAETAFFDVMTSPLVEAGYVMVSPPTYHYERRARDYFDRDEEEMPHVMIPACLTKLGNAALKTLRSDVIWSMTYHKPLFELSWSEWQNYLLDVRYENHARVFERVERLHHRMYNMLKEQIPQHRLRVWQEHLKRCSPIDPAWVNLKASREEELEELRDQRLALHRACWMSAIPQAERLGSTLFGSARFLEPTQYGDVIQAAHDRHVALWIAHVQKISDPNSTVFNEVESLPERYDLVKAEAFLQKMKCWTPLDETGRRT